MGMSRGMSLYLSWLLVLGLKLVSPSAGLNFTVVPQNVSISTGKSAVFQCGVSSSSLNGQSWSFIVQTAAMNYSLTCPGQPMNYPVLSLNGQCENTPSGIIATWNIANVANSMNGTIFRCHFDGFSDKYGYLWITGSSSYYAMLFGCVMGGFFGILVVFGISYVLLKRSERLQNCFKGQADDDGITETEISKGY